MTDVSKTNQIQAEEINRLKYELKTAQHTGMKYEAELLIARAKHHGLLAEFRAMKALLRHLGASSTDIEWTDEQQVARSKEEY